MSRKKTEAQSNSTLEQQVSDAVDVKEKKELSKKTFEEVDSLPTTSTATSWIWIKDTNGRPSMSATFATIAFFVTTLSFVFSMFESIGPFTFRAFDVGACGAYLVPILTLYFSRRWSADRIDIDKLKSQSNAARSSTKKEAENNE
jgi:hypothetical protein